MSIWSSIGDNDLEVPDDLEVPELTLDNQYQTKTGPSLSIDVATATSWRDDIRLSICDLETLGMKIEVEVLLSPEKAVKLRDRLNAAIQTVTLERS